MICPPEMKQSSFTRRNPIPAPQIRDSTTPVDNGTEKSPIERPFNLGVGYEPWVARSASQMAAMINARNRIRINTAMRDRRRFRAILSAPGLARCTAAEASTPARYSGLFSSVVSTSVLPSTTSRSFGALHHDPSLVLAAAYIPDRMI